MIAFTVWAFVVVIALFFILMAFDACVVRPLVSHWRNPPPPTGWFFAPHPDDNHPGG
jgi:hypothetical protein